MANEVAGFEKSQPVTEQQPQGIKVYSPAQSHFLLRLKELKAKREEYRKNLSPDAQFLPILDHSIYSTYMDCVRLGLGEEAKAILSRGEDQPIAVPPL